MAEEIVIKTVLDLSGSEQRLKQQIEKALGSPEAQATAKNAGKKIGDALGAGIETTRRPREDAETRHLRRIEAIAVQSNARLVEIERRKQSQLDLIRERAVQKELEHARKIERETQRGINSLNSFRSAVASVQGVFATLAGLGVVALFERIGRASIDAAVAIDRQVNTLRALTGSAEAAQKRFADLFALAQRTPGLTTQLAATLDAQLRILNVSLETIDRVLPAIGRLNAISPLGDPTRFAGNLVQLITQGFERQDLKELVGNSPFAGQLIKEIFNVDSPTNAAAIRESAQKLGINTVEEFFTAFAKAAENNPRLQAVQESLGTQFEKLQDRITVALAPIGDELLKTIIPAFKDLVELLERDAPKITALLRDNRDELLAVASAFVTAASAVGALVGEFRKLDQQFGIIRALTLFAVAINPLTTGAAVPLAQSFTQADSRTVIAGPIQSIKGLTGEQLLRKAQGEGDLFLLQTAHRVLEQERQAAARSGGGGTLDSGRTGREREDRAAKQLAEARKQLSDAVAKSIESAAEDLDKVNKELRTAIIQDEKKRRDDQAFVARRLIEQRESRRELTAEFEARAVETLQRTSRRGLQRSGRFIGDAVARGQITAGEAELLSQGANRDFANQLREVLAIKEQMVGVNDEVLQDLRDEIELYDRLGTAISDSERFMRGFNSQIETSGDIWDRFGQNVSRAFTNIKDIFNGLKSAVLGFFNDLLGNSIQNIVRQTLGPLFGGLGSAGGGGLFRTPGTFPAQIAQAVGGGISVPGSVSAGIPGLGSIFSGGGGGGAVSGGLGDVFGGVGQIFTGSAPRAAGGGFNFSGIGQSLANAAPLLGLTIGSSLGGQSRAGQILGGAGGLLASTFISTSLGAPGALGSLAPALFSNPITAIAGAGLLVGAVLLGKASQRKKDEEASGQFLTQALQGIEQLAAAVAGGQITSLGQARQVFDTEILGAFRQQISGLKTKSVRESRLTNQVRDLQKVFDARIPPLIAEQERRAADQARFASIDRRLIPEFATGGTTRGGLAILHPGEKIVNQTQQAAMRAIAGPNIFERAGVPGPSRNRVFDVGGTMPTGGVASQPMTVEVDVTIEMGKNDQTQVFVTGASTDRGRQAIVRSVKDARTNREL